MNLLIPKEGKYNLSANRLSMMQECTYKLYLYLSHQDTGPVDYTYINAGNAVHQYMEDRLNGIVKEKDFYMTEFEVSPTMNERMELCIENAKPYLDLKGDSELSKDIEFTTPKGRKINMRSRIDFITDKCTIPDVSSKIVIDWKTGKKINTPGYKIQMHVYRFILNQEYDAMLVSLLTGDTIYMSKSPKNYIPKLCDKYVDTIESNSFERSESPLCTNFCPYYDDFCAPGRRYDLVVPKMTWDDVDKKWVE